MTHTTQRSPRTVPATVLVLFSLCIGILVGGFAAASVIGGTTWSGGDAR